MCIVFFVHIRGLRCGCYFFDTSGEGVNFFFDTSGAGVIFFFDTSGAGGRFCFTR